MAQDERKCGKKLFCSNIEMDLLLIVFAPWRMSELESRTWESWLGKRFSFNEQQWQHWNKTTECVLHLIVIQWSGSCWRTGWRTGRSTEWNGSPNPQLVIQCVCSQIVEYNNCWKREESKWSLDSLVHFRVALASTTCAESGSMDNYLVDYWFP